MNRTESFNYFTPAFSELNHLILGEQLYQFLDSGQLSKEAIGTIVRNRYPETAELVDRQHRIASLEYYHQSNESTLNPLRKAIGKVGAFNYIRGMEVLRSDGSVDREVAPRIMLSPSASVQVLETAQVDKEDKVLELFCGGGYASFFLALETPQVLDSVDLYTPTTHDLNKTFQHAYEWIYEEVPQGLRPPITPPHFISADASRLVDHPEDPKLRRDYSKVFLHPPYGRESRRVSTLRDLTETDAQQLWIESLRHISALNTTPFQSYSTVPSEWAEIAQREFRNIQSVSLRETNKFDMSIVIHSNSG